MESSDQYGVDLHGISFEVRSGEILGIAGISGNGQTELMDALSGEVPVDDDDSIIIGDKTVGGAGPVERRAAGMSFVPEERLGHGAVPEMSLWENAILSGATRKDLVKSGFIQIKKTSTYASEIVEKFKVKTPGVLNAADSLSGGNLQKFIFGREILQDPSVIVVLQPTWGVDAGSAAAIRQSLLDLAAGGAAVLVISQDLEELFEVADQIAVICEGRLSGSWPPDEITVDEIGLLMAGVEADPRGEAHNGEAGGHAA